MNTLRPSLLRVDWGNYAKVKVFRKKRPKALLDMKFAVLDNVMPSS